MHERLATLTERERETLRLLLRGYDAKSIARELGLSVHTINERLRDARRKLGVSSSREAARIANEAEQTSPDSDGDKPFGVAPRPADAPSTARPRQREIATVRLAWLSGGMLVMSVSIALAGLAQGVFGSSPPQAEPPQPVALPAKDEASASSGAARLWLAQLDRQDWAKSWHAASQLFRANVTMQQWTSTIQSVRQPLGARSSRSLVSVTKTSSLPGVPAGDYEVLQFRTDFANRKNVIETVTFTREPSGWRVAGYFVQ